MNKKRIKHLFIHNWEWMLLCMPAIIGYLLFHYIPMIGLILPFTDFRINLGLFGSQWNNFRNFEFIFGSVDLFRIVRNTVGYSLAGMIISPIFTMGMALLLFELTNRKVLKFIQTVYIFPTFMSWIVISFITHAILSPRLGILSQVLEVFGITNFDAYLTRGIWPYIMISLPIWRGVGMGSIIYYAALMGIDPQLYEAARIDGASRRQCVRYISIPMLIPLYTILLILSIGNIFTGNFELFYQIPRQVTYLLPVTDIIETYVFRGLQGGHLAVSAAVGLIQSVVGFVLVLATNRVVAVLAPENRLF